MRKILILMGRYLPGHKDGGPLRTIVNVTEALGDEYEFHIACLDRDHGDTEPYHQIQRDTWNRVGKALVFYEPPGAFTEKEILRLSEGMDLIYLTSFYEDYGYRTLLLKKHKRLSQPIVVASMGVFAREAMAHKALKKRLFLYICRMLGLFRGITWSVSSILEEMDVKSVIGSDTSCVVAEDIPRSKIPGSTPRKGSPFSVTFLSRICAHKGLSVAIDAVAAMEAPVKFTVFGPIQEVDYWNHCRDKMEQLGILWTYGGDIPSDSVQQTLAGQDVLILPTRSENYGHVVFEALSVGCIPVISDRTPWSFPSIEQGGCVCRLDASEFTDCLNKLACMSKDELDVIRRGGVLTAKQKAKQAIAHSGYHTIFHMGL